MGQITNVVSAINAIVTDVEANVSLPTHETVKFAQPKVVTPERTPLLACYFMPALWELIATPSTYYMRGRIAIAWHVSGSESAETGGANDDDVALGLATVADAMTARLERMSEGIPTLTGIYARLGRTLLSGDVGAVWNVTHELEVEA